MDELVEDEDVVFEGSAIHQHLQEAGFYDYEVAQTEPLRHAKKEKNISTDLNLRIDWLLWKKKFADVLSFLLWPKNLRKCFYKRVPRLILESKVLNSDDQVFLRHFLPEMFDFQNEQKTHSDVFEIFTWLIKWVSLIMAVIVCIVLSMLESTSWRSFIIASFISSACWIVTISWMSYKHIKEVEKFVKILKDSAHLMSRSIRLLLEEDLISRGFFLAQGSSSFLSSNGKEAPHCQGLRLSLHRTLHAMLPVLSSIHGQLKVLVHHYSSMRGLFEDYRQMEPHENESWPEHLKFLKNSVTIVRLQMSATLTEVLLCAADEELFEQALDKPSVFSYHMISQVKKEVDLLSKHLAYAQSFWQTNTKEEEPKISFEEKKEKVYIAIHSVTLHMQAALLRAQNLKKKFEILEVSGDCTDNGDCDRVLPPYEMVKEYLNSIRTELQSCQGCLDEASARVDRKYEVKAEGCLNLADSENRKEITEVTLNEASKRSHISLFDIEHVIKDEVFEAYIDEECVRNREKDRDDDFWNTNARQERKKMKRQKEQGKRVIIELQPVLTKLREVWEERETAALQRQQCEFSQALTSNDISPAYEKPKRDMVGIDIREENVYVPPCISLMGESDLQNRRNLSEKQESESCEEQKILHDVIEFKFENKLPLTGNNLEDNDYERLEFIQKVNCQEALADEDTEDSDEERLALYRKVRMELEADERHRNDSEIEDNDERIITIHRSHRDQIRNEQCQGKNSIFSENMRENIKEKFQLPINTKPFMSESIVSEVNFGCADEQLNRNVETKIDKNSKSIQKCDLLPVDAKNAFSGALSDSSSRSVIPDVGAKANEKLTRDMEETYVYGEDSNDNDDDSPCIDWSAVSLPSRLTETLEDHLQLFCGGQNRGFHAQLATEAQAASRQFLGNLGHSDESFQGTGDGEECFGDDESE